MDRRTIVIAGAIVIPAFLLSAGIVIVTYIWSSHNRYHLAGTGGNFAYEVDRLTGKTWFVQARRKVLVSE